MSALKVGLTGGLAAGKSTVGRHLEEAGLRVLDADAVVAALYAPGEAGVRAVADLFGEEMLDDSGAVDHARLAHRVFSDAEARQSLEAVIHPLVRRRFEELAHEADGIVVLEAPLLVEAGFAADCDVVITVEADPEQRLEWAVTRGLEREQAEARIAAQTQADVRIAAADLVVHNDGSLADLERRADALAAALRNLAAARAQREPDEE